MQRALVEFEPVRHLMPAATYAEVVKLRIYAIIAVEHLGCRVDLAGVVDRTDLVVAEAAGL